MQDRRPAEPNNGNPIPEFTPVPRKYRHDGWTPERQRAFIAALAETASVSRAAKRLNMSPEGAYFLRRQPGADEFRASWTAALDHGVQRLTDIAIDRATQGVPIPVFWRGEQVGERRWYNDRLLMFILKHHQPRTYNPPKLPTGTKHIDTLRREWAEEQAVEAREAGVAVMTRLNAIRRLFKRRIAADPAKRAAWELLTGPTEWTDFDKVVDYGWGPNMPDTNQNRPDMIVTMAMPVEEDGETVGDRLFGGGTGSEDEDQTSAD